VLFIATNTDSTFPGAGVELPGGGTMVAAIETCTFRKATVMGKPETRLMELILATYHFDRSKTIMVGDRLDTDILFGKNSGVDSLMVLTGINTIEDAESFHITPTYVLNTISDLLSTTIVDK